MISVLIFAGATIVLQYLNLPLGALFLTVLLVLALALRLMPQWPAAPPSARVLPRWDIPARMMIATAFVMLLTGLAPILGLHLTGLLAPFPLYATILAVFAHHLQGPAAASEVLRGLLVGLFAFASFFLVLAIWIEQIGIAPTFVAAILVAVVLQGMSLWVLRYMPR